MAPGKKLQNRKPTSPPREAPLTDIEIRRMQNILEHNRLFQRLGLGQLHALVNAKPVGAVKTKGAAKPVSAAKPTDAGSEDSGSLYRPGDEDMEQEVVDKEAMLDLELELSNSLPNNVSNNIRGSRTSKRVMAISEEQSQPSIITRKRARELAEPAEDCHVPATDPQDGATDQELIVANAHTQSHNRNMTDQDPCMDKRRMGKGLDRISRGLNNKIKVHIAPGNKRPEAPMQAAQIASEAGIFIRDNIPIFPHWKDDKGGDTKELRDDYMAKIGKQTKYKDAPLTAIDLFKETHCSSKTGFSENAQSAIAQMEEKAAAPPQEGQDVVTPAQAVLQVMPKTTILRNIGMQHAASKRGTKASEVDARVQELQNELVAEKEGSTAVRVQIDDMENKLEEERAARKKVEEEHEILKKQIGEMHGFFRAFLGGNSASSGAQQ